MLNPFERKKLLRRVYREQERLLDESFEFQHDRNITEEEQQHLKTHADHIRFMLERLAPRRTLDWISILVRIGIATILFIIVVAPPYQYLRSQYLNTDIIDTSASGIGSTSVVHYVPVEAANVSEFALIKKEVQGGLTTFVKENTLDGMSVGILPDQKGQPRVFWTEKEGDRRVLKSQLFDRDLRPKGVTSTLWGDADVVSASVASSSAGSVAVMATKEAGAWQGRVLRLDNEGRSTGDPTVFSLDEANEAGHSIYMTGWDGRWVVLTVTEPPAGSSALTLRRIVMRILDDRFTTVWKKTLISEALTVGEFPSFFTDAMVPGGFYVVVNARPPVTADRLRKGDEIYAMRFDKNGEALSYLRLTNNGRAHDFAPASAITAPDGRRFLAFHRIDASGFGPSDGPTGYPPESGRSYIFGMTKVFSILGTLSQFQDQPAYNQTEMIGASHTRLFMQGQRLFIAYDLLDTELGSTGLPERKGLLTFMDIAR